MTLSAPARKGAAAACPVAAPNLLRPPRRLSFDADGGFGAQASCSLRACLSSLLMSLAAWPNAASAAP